VWAEGGIEVGQTGVQSGGDILQPVLLLVIGAAVGLVSSLITLVMAEYLNNRRQDKLLVHERELWGTNTKLDSVARSKDRELGVQQRRRTELLTDVGTFQRITRIGLVLGLVVLGAALALLVMSVRKKPDPVRLIIPSGSATSVPPMAMVTPPTLSETPIPFESPSINQTATALALAGVTATPLPGFTPQPTGKPAPTNLPASQYRFSKVSEQDWPNCGSTGIKVYFKTRGGQPYPGMQFAVYAGGACIGLSGWANQMDGSSDFVLSPDRPRSGSWEIRAVKTVSGESGAGVCGPIAWIMSASIPVTTVDSPCDTNSSGVQWIWLTLQEN